MDQQKFEEKREFRNEENPPAYTNSGMPNVAVPQNVQMQMGYPAVAVQPIGVIYATPRMHFGDRSQQSICPNCQATVMTQVHHETGLITWLIAGGLCLVGCSLGCCLVSVLFCFFILTFVLFIPLDRALHYSLVIRLYQIIFYLN